MNCDFMIKDILPHFLNDIPCHIVEDSVLDDPDSLFQDIFPEVDFSTYAFICTSNYNSHIFIRRSVYDNIHLRKVVLSHEYAHFIGIYGEEEADSFAMSSADDEGRKLLKENWLIRHGQEYEEWSNYESV